MANVAVMILALLLKFSWVLFLVALFASFGSRGLYARGDLRKARWAALTSFIASSLLAVLYLTVFFIGKGFLDAIIAAVWGWFAWRDYKFLQILPKS